ncbi:integrase domain-containing protein [Paraburkholderia xenovorans]
MIARLCQRDRWVAIQVELQAAFGLRAQEACCCVRYSVLAFRATFT